MLIQALGCITLKMRIDGWTFIFRPYLELSFFLKEEVERVIDDIEEDLRAICRKLGFEYIRPEATVGLVRILEDNPSRFFLMYRQEVQNVVKAGCSKVFME